MTKRTCRPVPLQVRRTRAEQRKLVRTLHRAYLARCRKRYESGHADGLLDAVDGCVRTGRKVPLWAAQPFCERYLDWADARVQTLDQAFGISPLSRRKFRARKEHNRLRPLVVYRVIQLHTIEKKPIGGELFAKVAEELHTSEATVRRIYYDKLSEPPRKIFTNATLS